MIRVLCTWILVLLAASPFTAPFSTCSVSVLLDQTASIQLPAPSGLSVHANRDKWDAFSDAFAVSPVLKKIDLAGHPQLVSVVPLNELGVRGRSVQSFSTDDGGGQPARAQVQSAVLRI
jgi:hypothetical protein